MSTEEHSKGRSRAAGPKLFLALVLFIAVALVLVVMLSPIHFGPEPNLGTGQTAGSH